MKKLLQRIGLLAAAVMLLWGWQGMEAKAEEGTGKFVYQTTGDAVLYCDTIGIAGTQLIKGTQADGTPVYWLRLYSYDQYIFTAAPTVVVKDSTGKQIETCTGKQHDDYAVRYYVFTIKQIPSDDNAPYTIEISGGNYIEKISQIDIRKITPPAAGQPLPQEQDWLILTTGTSINYSLKWIDTKTQEVVSGNAKPNTTYCAELEIEAVGPGYGFYNPAITTYPTTSYTVVEKNIDTYKLQFSFTTGNTNTEITWEKWNDWTINRDKLENGHIAKGYGLSGSAAESHDAHLFLYVEPKDGYYFTEEPKVSWNDTLLVPLPKDSSTLYGYKYQLDDNGKGTIFVEGKAVKKDTAEPQTNEPQANTSQSSNDTYKIINGAKSTWNGSTTEGLTIRGDGDFAKFAGVRVDGNWIPSAHYEAKSGSTIVTLKPSYLASLAEGEHTVDIMWIDDSASTTFTVAANTAAAQPELDSVPKTGEGVMGWMPEILLLAAAGLVTFGGILRRRSKIHL